MAITDNNFTADEFKSAVEANPELLKNVTTVLPERGFVVRSKEENDTFLRNYEEQVISNKTKEFALNLEKDVKELTGLDKASPDEKYYEFLKRAVSTKLQSVKTLEQELTALKEKKGGEGVSEEEKKRIKDLELALEKQKGDYAEALSKKDQELTQYKAQNEVEKRMIPLRASYKPNIPKFALEAAEEKVLNELIPNLIFTEDGKIMIKGKDGETLKDPKLLEPVTLEAYLSDRLKDFVDEGKEQRGAGTGKGDKDEGKGGKFTGIPAGVETKVQLGDYLKKLGIMNPEYDKILEEHGKNLPLR